MKTITSYSLNQTESIAQKLAQRVKPGEVICISGELGAGKTSFTQALLKALGVKEKVVSPTYTIMHEYHGQQIGSIYHVDLYRLNSTQEIETIGIRQLVQSRFGLLIIEWPEKIAQQLPKESIRIHIDILDESSRQFIFEK